MRAYLEFGRESLIYCKGSTLSNPLQLMGEASCQPLAYPEIFNSTLFSEWLMLSIPLQVSLWRFKFGHRLTGYLKCGIKVWNWTIGLVWILIRKFSGVPFSEFPPRVNDIDTFPGIQLLYLLVTFFIIGVSWREYHKNGKLLNT